MKNLLKMLLIVLLFFPMKAISQLSADVDLLVGRYNTTTQVFTPLAPGETILLNEIIAVRIVPTSDYLVGASSYVVMFDKTLFTVQGSNKSAFIVNTNTANIDYNTITTMPGYTGNHYYDFTCTGYAGSTAIPDGSWPASFVAGERYDVYKAIKVNTQVDQNSLTGGYPEVLPGNWLFQFRLKANQDLVVGTDARIWMDARWFRTATNSGVDGYITKCNSGQLSSAGSNVYAFNFDFSGADIHLALPGASTSTITFDVDGGSAIAPITQTEGSVVTAPTDPTKTGYTFMGWLPVIPATMPVADLTCVAQWNPATDVIYTINIYQEKAAQPGIYELFFTYQSTGTTGTLVTVTPANYDGFIYNAAASNASGIILADGSLVLNLYYNRDAAPTSTITFNTGGGSPIAPITQDEGTTVTAPANPTKTGYTFQGWVPAVPATMPVDDITCVAQWQAIPNPTTTISFDMAGGTPAIAPITQDEGTAVTAPADPTKTGYTFQGWVPSVPATMPVDDVTCVAQWQAIPNPTTTISFDIAGGTPTIASIIQDEGTAVTAPDDPTKTGYTFAGWVPAVPATMPVDDLTCVAQWQTIPTSTITFDLAGGTPSIAPITQEEGTAVTAPADPTKTGYTFQGWVPAVPATMPVADLTCVAQWSAASSCGVLWTARTAAEVNMWSSVTYGNGLFVAVAANGTNRVMTSPDGITWTARTAAEANQWISVTYANGVFVAVAGDGTNRVMTSPDGITWTARTAAEANQWYSVTYGNGMFVAVSKSGTNRVMTSPDGFTWTARTAAGDCQWQSVTYGNGVFVAVAMNGTNKLMTSPDGITWTARVESDQWQSVTYGNNLFVAVSNDGLVMTSPDGITWTDRTAAAFNAWQSVTYGNGLFVAVAPIGSFPRVMTSPDGIIWTSRTAAEDNYWWSVTYGNNMFVAVSFTGTSRVMTSECTSTNPQSTITFNTDGGSAIAPITQEEGTAVTAPADPTKTGYTFAGWVPAAPATMPVDDITCVAQWQAIPTSTITFNVDGGSAIAPITGDEGSTVTAPANPTKAGYTFMGWLPTIPATMPVADETCVAQWEAIPAETSTITFNVDGGSAIAPITGDEGTTVTAPADPTKAGYTFMGWLPVIPATFPVADLTCVAQWNPATDVIYTINIYQEKAAQPGIYELFFTYQSTGTTGTLVTVTPANYDGFIYNSAASNASGIILADGSLVLNFYYNRDAAPTSTITFNTGGGSPIAPITQDEGSTVTAPADPSKTGYTFAGWVPAVPATMPVDDITCVAQWQAIPAETSTITFNVDGGSAIAPIIGDEGTTVTAPADPTKAGYTFMGWLPVIPATFPVADLTCVAQWQSSCTNPFSGGTIALNQTICAGATPTIFTSVSLPLGHTGTLEYQWQRSTDSIDFVDLATGTYTATTYQVDTITVNTWYRRLARVSCMNDWTGAAKSNVVKITVEPTPISGTLDKIPNITNVCEGTNVSAVLTAGSGGNGLDSLVYRTHNGIEWSSWTTYTTGTNITTTDKVQVQVLTLRKASYCDNSTATTVSWNIDSTTVGGSVSGGSSVCTGSASDLLTLSGHAGTVVRWQSSVTPYSSWTNITNTNITYTSGTLAASTRFRAVVKNGVCSNVSSTSTLVTVSPVSVGGTVSSDQSICMGTKPANLTLSGNTGNVVRWEKASDSFFTTPVTVAITTTTLTGTTIGNLTSPTYFRAVVKSGSCSEANSSYVLISVDPTTVGGTVSGNSSVCSGNTSGLLSLTGYTGTVQKWQYTVSPFTTWTDITNTNDTITSGALTETTRFRAVVKSGACLTLNSGYKQIVVKPNPTFTSGTVSSSNCYGNDVIFTASGLLPNINNTFYSTIAYGSTVLQITRNIASDALGNATYTGVGFSPDNYSYELTSITVSGCTSNFTGLTSGFVVHSLPTASISGSTTICANTDQPEISFNGANGTPPYTFTYSLNSGSNLTVNTTIGNLVTVAQPTNNPGSFVYNLISVADSNACSQLQTGTVTIIIDSTSVGGSISGASTITYGSSTGTLTLGGYRGIIQKWQKKLNTGNWIDISNTNATYSETTSSAGTWYYKVVVKSGICSETTSAEFAVTVQKKALSITADAKIKVYDGLIYSPFTVSYNGFVLGQSAANLGGTLSFGGSAATATDIGTYTIIPSGQTSNNYTISYNNGNLIINCNTPVNVINTSNSGYGSLRNAIANVCNNGTIVFATGLNGQTITLTTGAISIDKNITFDNCTHNTGVSISGIGDNFIINTGKSLIISGCSKITVTGAIKNNSGISGLVIASGASFIHNTVDLPATVQRNLTNVWHLFGSPFKKNTGAMLANITGTTQMMPYTNGTGWGTTTTSPLTLFVPTVGYAIKPSATITASFTGNLYYSAIPADFTTSLIYNGTSATQSWNLIANPYTSSIDFNLLGKTNLSSTLYYWDNAYKPNVTPIASASYMRTYNSCNGVGVPAGTLSYIAPLQGFFVKAVYTSPKLAFIPSARVHKPITYYKDASNTEILVRLKTETEEGTDELVICKNENSKLDFEQFDSEKLFNDSPVEIYSQSASGENLVINTINVTANNIIPLGIRGNAGKKVKITAFALETAEQVYLEDRFKGKLINLTENTAYEFELPNENLIGRFFIRFNNTNAALTTSDVKVFENNNELNIIAQTGEDLQTVEVYSLTGACVFKAEGGNSNVFNTKLQLAPAVYMVRVKTSIATQNVKVSWK